MAQPIVLCYHGVCEEWDQALAVRPRAFERQLESLLRRGYRPVEAGRAVTGAGRLLHVTFDDAYRNIAKVLPVLERLGTPATIFAAAAFADEGGRPLDVPELAEEAAAHPQHLATMDWDELRAIADRGFEVGSHTVSHPHLPRLSDAELDRELTDSRARCEAELGRPCRFLAYPYGEHDVRVQAAARRAGYEAAFSLHSGDRSNRYAVPRVDFYRRDSLSRATLKTTALRRPAYALAGLLRRDRAPAERAIGFGWLAAALPADARRVQTADPELAATLAAAGAEIVERHADVEIGPARALRGDSLAAIATVDARPHDSRSRSVRIVRRAGNTGMVRLRAARARRAMPARSYPHADVVLWDNTHAWRGPGTPAGPRTPVERLPQHAVVIGHRGPRRRTLLDAVREEAGRAAGCDLSQAGVSVRSGGLLLLLAPEAVLRVAVGLSGRQISAQVKTLRALHAASVDPLVAGRVSEPLAHGRTRLAEWSVERRLPGATAGGLTEPLMRDVVDFLVALHRSPDGGAGADAADDAAAVGSFTPADADALERRAAEIDGVLAGCPRGFGHGDFFLGNLLVEEGRLSGVIDWDAGGHGRMPLLDLLHLRHAAAHDVPDEDWGMALVEHLLPWARSGGDPLTRDYCGRVGIDHEPRVLEALVLRYWLDRLAYQLRTHEQRRSQPRWLERNVSSVLDALAPK
jgi:peptidoglycan/xylan/chitin deacetylase (PgdA/CDA1 family)